MILAAIILAFVFTHASVAKAAPVSAPEQFQRQFIAEWKALARENRLELIAVLPDYPPLNLPQTLAARGGTETDRMDRLAIKWRVSWRVSHGYLLLGPQYAIAHPVRPAPGGSVLPPQQREASSLPLHEPERHAMAFLEGLTPEQRAAIARDGSLPMAAFSTAQFEQMRRGIPGQVHPRAKNMGPDTPGYVRFIFVPSLFIYSNGEVAAIASGQESISSKPEYSPLSVRPAPRHQSGNPRGRSIEIPQPEMPVSRFIRAVAVASCAHNDVTMDDRLERNQRRVFTSTPRIPLGPARDFVSKTLRGEIRVVGPLCHVGYLDDLPSEADARGCIVRMRRVIRILSGFPLKPSARHTSQEMQRLCQLHPRILEAGRPLYRVELPAETWTAIESLHPQLRGLGRHPKVAIACFYSVTIQPVAVLDEPPQPGGRGRAVGLALIPWNTFPGPPLDSLAGDTPLAP